MRAVFPAAAVVTLLACRPAAAPSVSVAASPPPAAPPFVDVSRAAPGVRLDMRYAAPDNFLHAAVYPCARCLLREPAAKAIAAAEVAAEARGFHLLLWDCYRPPAVQKAMWAIEPDPRFVADPAKGSVHNRGGAVDVSLTTATGAAVTMPTKHDDFSVAAYADAPASAEAAKNRATLRAVMSSAGFAVMPTEWWHFDYQGSRAWPIEDVPLCAGQ
ncbi:MAG TPA: M15 family metallopeptidase [bacterium]|nr:M15 family metallopeptidase [bacterium]